MAAEVKVLAIQVAAKVLVVQVVTEVEAEVGAEGAATTAAAPKQRKEVKRRIGGRNEIARVVGSSGIKPTKTNATTSRGSGGGGGERATGNGASRHDLARVPGAKVSPDIQKFLR